MKKMMLPVFVVIVAIAIAQFFFGIDMERLFKGFIDFLADLLDGPE